ncbi:MAG: phosphoribosylanthranilate isomerase [Syntrophobacteraceae bacterium]
MTEKIPAESNGSSPQVKVCGLTRVEEAVACAALGANAIGLVFYPPSPRFVGDALAREIAASLPARVWPVGVFVNEPCSVIMKKVERCRLKAVQLHGAEPPYLIYELLGAGVAVIKSLFVNGRPAVRDASSFPASAYLIEAGGGPLPGGNAMSWNWGEVKGFSGERSCILAGGLDHENVVGAINEVSPDAVDVSSGVESAPGRKNMAKVKAFLEAVRQSRPERKPRRIFQ